MKTNYLLIISALLAFSVSFFSCSDDDGDGSIRPPQEDKTEIFVERLSGVVGEMTSLRDGATYGEKKGDYPESSKGMLDDELSYLNETISKMEDGTKKLTESEMDRIINEANQISQKFKATQRAEDFQAIPSELQVNGKNGGYIDFGVHPEYSNFGESGKQAFTVDFWIKLTDTDQFLNSFVYILSTFTDDADKDHERKGWAVNSHFGRMRMTYGISYSDLFEPGYDFSTLNQWVHIAMVTDENGVDGEIVENIPVMVKMYLNGELVLSEKGRDDRLPYTPNDKDISMTAFGALTATGGWMGDKATNGCMKHLHIWNSAKNQQQVQDIMNSPEKISGTEADLVCGWTLDKTVVDNNKIMDITGKYPAKLTGDFQWINK